MSIDITIEEMEALPAESYELFDIRGEIERAHGILPNSTASSADVLMEKEDHYLLQQRTDQQGYRRRTAGAGI